MNSKSGTNLYGEPFHILGEYLARRENDPADERYPWSVYDAEMDEVDCYATEAEALAYLREQAEQVESEAREERIQALRDDLSDLIGECENEDVLNQIKVLLSRTK